MSLACVDHSTRRLIPVATCHLAHVSRLGKRSGLESAGALCLGWSRCAWGAAEGRRTDRKDDRIHLLLGAVAAYWRAGCVGRDPNCTHTHRACHPVAPHSVHRHTGEFAGASGGSGWWCRVLGLAVAATTNNPERDDVAQRAPWKSWMSARRGEQRITTKPQELFVNFIPWRGRWQGQEGMIAAIMQWQCRSHCAVRSAA